MRKKPMRLVPYNKGTFDASWMNEVIKEYLKNTDMSEKLRLFQYAVILHKKKKDKDSKDEYVGAELIVEPKYIMAKNEKEVVFKATREVPDDKAGDPDNVEIFVRPF